MTERWSYPLTIEEEAICAQVGYERQLPYITNPSANRNYCEGPVWEIWQHSIAAGSELAFARMVGLTDFVPHVNKWNTVEDVPPFEIRYCFTQPRAGFEHSLRLHNRDKDDHVYVLLTGGLEIKKRSGKNEPYFSHPYTAVGWIYGKEGRITDYEDYYGGWRVPATRLRKMSELDEAGW
jgi:hypothetical protein